jgi:hypothetical protein
VQPCRSLQFAVNIALAGGEIQILDSGFYGNNATINKSLPFLDAYRTMSIAPDDNLRAVMAQVRKLGVAA